MSELPKNAVDTSIQEPIEEPEDYRHYFGMLSRQASINALTAYVEGSHSMEKGDDRNVALAWLLDDARTLEKFAAVEHREAKLHGALMRASTAMWGSMFMQRYSDMRPERLHGLTQSEIPTV